VSTPEVYISTGAFASRDLDTILDICAEHDIDALELGDVSTFDLERLGGSARPARLLVHNYFPPPQRPFLLNLASRDPDVLARSRAHCRAAIDLSQRLGGPIYAAHAGYAADLPPELLGRPERQAAIPPETLASPEETYSVLVESARELARYAEGRGVRFLIENHALAVPAGELGRRLLPMVEPGELLRLCRDVEEPSFGLLVDVGHLKVSATAAGFDAAAALDELTPRIAALHLSDNDGDTDLHRPFGDDAWFLPRLRRLANAVVTVEIARTDVRTILDVRDTVSRWR
jgi:sugar phosphate isomerase/epimerase